MTKSIDQLRLNVGFIIHQTVGYSREFHIDLPEVQIAPDLDLKNLVGSVHITRTAKGLLMRGKLNSLINIQCVRCLTEFLQALEIDFTELLAFSIDSAADSGMLVPESGIIELDQLVREEMLLAIPISPLCKLECHGLCPVCGEDRNINSCHHELEPIDPRLSVLKTLLEED